MIVFHLHIPRTGGTGCAQSLRVGFTDRRFVKFRSVSQVERDPNIKQDPVVVSGHFYWGIHELFKRDHIYFVVLRDPLEHPGSMYDYVRAREGHKDHPLWSRTSLHQLLIQDPRPAGLSNWQVRQLGGFEHRKEPMSTAVLERAWQHLSQENVIVTFTDMVNDGLLQLSAQTGIYFKHLRRKHNAARRSPLSEETIQLIRKVNAFDIELYNRARAEFMHRLEKPARLPQVAPLQVYQERVTAYRAKEEALDVLLRRRSAMALQKSENRKVSRPRTKPAKQSRSLEKLKKLLPLNFQLALKKRFDRSS